jgi:hypothetical protein
MNRYVSLALLFGAVAIAACDKNARQDITAPAVGTNVKFFNFGVGTPRVNFFANDQKITAIITADCQPPKDTTSVCRTAGTDTLGAAYGAAGNAGLYNAITPGQNTLTGRIAAVTDKNLAVSSLSATLDNSKYYSYYASGIYDATAKKVEAFIVEDPIPATIDPTQAYVRFVNAISNSQPMTLYAKSSTTGNEVAIGSTVTYKAAGTFQAVPGGVYDLNTRTAGSATNVITRTAVSFVAGRVYTVSSRGDMVSTVTANKPALDNTANR